MIMVDNIGNVSDLGRPSTFTKDQMVDIVLCLGELKNVFKVRRKFAKHRFSETSSTLDLEEIRRAVANVRKRAAACIECGGGHFEHLLKRLKMKLPRNRIKTVDNCKVMP